MSHLHYLVRIIRRMVISQHPHIRSLTIARRWFTGCGFALAVVACKEPKDNLYVLEGYIREYGTGASIPNMPVRIERVQVSGGWPPSFSGGSVAIAEYQATVFTDPNGYYRSTVVSSSSRQFTITVNQLDSARRNKLYWEAYLEREVTDLHDRGSNRLADISVRPQTPFLVRFRNTTPVDDSDRIVLRVESDPAEPIAATNPGANSPIYQFYAPADSPTAFGAVQHYRRIQYPGYHSFPGWTGRDVNVEQTFYPLRNEPTLVLWDVRKGGVVRSFAESVNPGRTPEYTISY